MKILSNKGNIKSVKTIIAARDYSLKIIKNQPKMKQKSPQVVKHVVKGEKWACLTLKAGKDKPIDYIAKTRYFARICEKIKEKRGFVMNPRFGLSDKT